MDLDNYKITNKFSNKELFNHINDIPEDYAYLMVGHWMQGEIGHDRKNVGLLVKAFYELFKEFKTKPALILKTSVVGGSLMDKAEVLRRINLIKESVPSKDLPTVYLLHGEFTDKEMNELYNHPKVKTMVCLTKGEGFGRPLLEFSAIDKPIITTSWSGHIDFLREGNVGFLSGELEEVHDSAVVNNMLLKQSKWFKPNLGDLKYLFNDTFNNYKDWITKAKRQGKISRKEFNYEGMKDLITSIFDTSLPILPKKMELKIPGMDKIKMPSKMKKLKTLKKV
jgi:glycosyltransferase involved in cell wall biosynthesis